MCWWNLLIPGKWGAALFGCETLDVCLVVVFSRVPAIAAGSGLAMLKCDQTEEWKLVPEYVFAHLHRKAFCFERFLLGIGSHEVIVVHNMSVHHCLTDKFLIAVNFLLTTVARLVHVEVLFKACIYAWASWKWIKSVIIPHHWTMLVKAIFKKKFRVWEKRLFWYRESRYLQ